MIKIKRLLIFYRHFIFIYGENIKIKWETISKIYGKQYKNIHMGNNIKNIPMENCKIIWDIHTGYPIKNIYTRYPYGKYYQKYSNGKHYEKHRNISPRLCPNVQKQEYRTLYQNERATMQRFILHTLGCEPSETIPYTVYNPCISDTDVKL